MNKTATKKPSLRTKPNTEVPTGILRNTELRKDSGQESSRGRETPLRIVHPSLQQCSQAGVVVPAQLPKPQFQSPLASATYSLPHHLVSSYTAV